MRVTSYAYPWDLANLGVEPTLKRMRDEGFAAVDLASTYHPIDSVSPRGGDFRLFTSGRGVVLFPAREERYGRIRPQVSTPEVCAAWPEAARVASKIGLGLNAWTITLFQPWIRDVHPDTARVLPGGDPSGSGLCPANADVREYLANLCEDIVDQFGVDIVRLEGVAPHTYDLDWLRPRALFAVPPMARTLLNLCFCKTCEGRATAAGVDVQRLRGTVNGAIAEEIAEGPGGPGAADRAARLGADTDLKAFATLNIEGSIELIRIVSARVKQRAAATRVSANAIVPYRAFVGTDGVRDLERQYVEATDQLAVHPSSVEANQRLADMARQQTPPRELSMLIARVQGRGGGAPPSPADPELLPKELQEMAKVGSTEIILYNYSILPEDVPPAFMAQVRKVFPQ